jgi:peptidoglycan/xylan/chitin deacetylase (PgdA/CDA1 family)
MKTKVVITVDTEPSIAGAFSDPDRFTPRIHEPVWGEIEGKSQALGFMLEVLTRFRLRATFFIETVHLAYFPESTMGNYVRDIYRAGHDIQLHLHPCWASFSQNWNSGTPPATDQCGDLGEEQLRAHIADGMNQIRDWTGTSPMGLRTGNFSASPTVYRAMKMVGMTVSSNICIAVAPPDITWQNVWGGKSGLAGGVHNINGIAELPITCFKDRGPVGRGRMRPMQITACTFAELRSQLRALHRRNASVAMIVTHPFEFLRWSGPDFSKLTPNRLVQRRFERLCGFLAENADQFETVPISHFSDAEADLERATDLDGNPISATYRAIENFVNDRLPLRRSN